MLNTRHLLDLIPINSLFAPNYPNRRVFPTDWGGSNTIWVVKCRFIGSQGTQLAKPQIPGHSEYLGCCLPLGCGTKQVGICLLSPGCKLKSGKWLQPPVSLEVRRKCEGKFFSWDASPLPHKHSGPDLLLFLSWLSLHWRYGVMPADSRAWATAL